MKTSKLFLFLCFFYLLNICKGDKDIIFDNPNAPPPIYAVIKTKTPPVIDGIIDNAEWSAAEFTPSFVDIFDPTITPNFDTQVKMMYDDNNLYIGAFLQEKDISAFTTIDNKPIYRTDNDFELFFSPNPYSHTNMIELEINAINTTWSLLLPRPYERTNMDTVDPYPIKVPHSNNNNGDFISAVHINGTLNNPSDVDKGWYVEIKFPFSLLLKLSEDRSYPPKGENILLFY
eukprot:TRINITY_DN5021_c0_g1_i2.p1 TRINITY_DN5021_c0_g1~~TRINITY_DN5021_c0_g1_i2.p1  ORF type:complete len:231 (+),score=42.35 TRINITY_DN5021_c0_g1_i2:1-693(+)